MFQSFDTVAAPQLAKERVASLRSELIRQRISAYIVPRADEHQGEYVPTCAERLHWLTGFSGSAGHAAVTHNTAAVFVDGRYTIQASMEVDDKSFGIEALKPGALATWLTENLEAGEIVGFDPALWTVRQVTDLKTKLAANAIKLKPLRANLIDKLWGEHRPPAPDGLVRLHPNDVAGRHAAEKIDDLQQTLKASRQDAVILTQPESICWLFNIRGSDVPHTPVVLAFAIVHQRAKPELFIEPTKLNKDSRNNLKTVARLRKPQDLTATLKALRDGEKTVRLDPITTPYRFERALTSKRTIHESDPCTLPKAIKNASEIEGARAAHVRDGAAIVRFLHWLDTNATSGIDEISAVKQLEAFRTETEQLMEISFDTISGSGANGAIVHYRVSNDTNRKLKSGELFLIDSGAQYIDGTTDITRTIAISAPTANMVRHTTLVLKGHIAIATAKYPKGTRGVDLDPFARRALWADGLDYDHGTGHGVGSYLSVHEGPASISRAGMVPLEPGMILSNEPGFYKAGHYGIRLENLVLVTDISADVPGNRTTFGFETLTLAPFDRNLISAELLDDAERTWLNSYHARVRKILEPQLSSRAEKNWLKNACAPI